MELSRNDEKCLPVFVACDKNYLPYTTVLCLSLVQHTARRLHIHIMHDGSLSPHDQTLTRELICKRPGTECFFDCMRPLDTFETWWPERFSSVAYYRLLISRQFPQYDKCIYLDSDTVVYGDLSELFDADLGGRFYGAVLDYGWMASYQQNPWLLGAFSSMRMQDYYRKIKLMHPERYYNSGVLLINLEEIRRRGQARVEEMIGHIGRDYYLVDQDLLNCFLWDEIMPLEDQWNVRSQPGKMPDSKILHYIDKPWRGASADAEKAAYWQLLKETPYYYQARAGMILREIEMTVNRGGRYSGHGLFRAFVHLFWALLRQIFLRIGGRR